MPLNINGSVIDFTAFYAEIDGVSVRGVAAEMVSVDINYSSLKGRFSVDARTLKEIRILETNDNLRAYCPTFKAGYAVVLKPEKGLPDLAEITINVSRQFDLDTLLGVLSYLSPQARLVEGIGI